MNFQWEMGRNPMWKTGLWYGFGTLLQWFLTQILYENVKIRLYEKDYCL